MRLLILIIMFSAALILPNACVYADDLGIRYNNLSSPDSSIGSLQFSGGKIMEVKYDTELYRNLYIEFAAGPYFASDFDKFTSFVSELSPGIQVSTGSVRACLSQGIAYMPNTGIPAVEYATHISISLIDSENNASIGIEKSHYSNGSSSADNIGMDMTGIIFDLHFF